jgi:hypothetical protein
MSSPAPPEGSAAADLLRRIAAASDGLLYSSESDRPFEPFFRPAERVPDALDPRSFAALVGAAPDDPAEEVSLERFLAPHIQYVSPADTRAWERLPRYVALRDLLTTELGDVRVFRIGRVQVRCHAVGRDRAGNLLGVETVAIET